MTDFMILGQQVREPSHKLETFPNPGVDIVVLETDEFTSLCPITRQPDFQTITISYRPRDKCLESKSLKLYLWTYRESGAFCESLSKQIADDIQDALQAHWVRVEIKQKPRGGISIQASSLVRGILFTSLPITEVQEDLVDPNLTKVD